MFVRFFISLNRYPKLILLFFALCTMLFFIQAQEKLFDQKDGSLLIDSTVEPFIERGSGVYEEFRRIRQIFGNEEMLIIAVQPQPDKELDLNFINALQTLSQKISGQVPGVSQVFSILNTPQPSGVCAGKSYFHQEEIGSVCVSVLDKFRKQQACLKNPPANVLQTEPPVNEEFDNGDGLDRGLDEGLDSELDSGLDEGLDSELDNGLDSENGTANTDVASFTEDTAPAENICTSDVFQKDLDQIHKEGEAAIRKSLAALSRNPLLSKDLISEDLKTVALVVQFENDAKPSESTTQNPLKALILDAKTNHSDSFHRIAYAGQPRQVHEAATLVREDLQKILPLSLLLIILVLLAVFRSPRAVMIPLGIVVLGVIWTAGSMGILGDRLNLVTMACAPILICVGSAYIIKLLEQFFQEAQKQGVQYRDAIDQTIEHVAVPVSVTALTTVAGFAALMTSPIPAIQQLGLYSSLGVLYINLFSLTLAPAILYYSHLPIPAEKQAKASWLSVQLEKRSHSIKKHSKRLIRMWVLIAIVMAIGVFMVRVDSTTKNFKSNSSIVQDLNVIENELAGTNTLRLIFTLKETGKGAVDTPALLSAKTIYGIHDLQQWLLQNKGQTEIGSIKGLRIDKIYSPVDYLDLYRFGLDGLKDKEVTHFFQEMEKKKGPKFFSPEEEILQITIRMRVTGSTVFLELRNLLDHKIPTFLPHLNFTYTGGGVLASESADNIAKGQAQSVTLALVIIFVILSIMFMSWKMGVIALFPNVVAVLVFFGMLGWFSIPLGVTISVIASIALGIGVDDTIHFLSHYNETAKHSQDKRTASQETLHQIARPMIFTTLALVSGFILFGMSEMDSQVLFGALTAFTLLVCLAADMTFLPAIVMETGLITVWDYVGLKFDEEFLDGIDLFQNVSISEAKIATLMANTVDLEQGDVLFNQGDVGKELFVILSGSVEIYLGSGENKTFLARIGAGKTFGEMGLFRNAVRSAAAAAEEPTQLLVLNKDILERLKRRNPEIANKFFMNIARGVGESLLKTKHRVANKERMQSMQEKIAGKASSEKASESSPEKADAPKKEAPDLIASNVFKDMTPRDQKNFKRYCTLKTLAPGDVAISRGDPTDTTAILLTGTLEVVVTKEEEEIVVATMEAVELVGTTALLLKERKWSSTVRATEESEALFINQKNLQTIIKNDIRLAAQFTDNMVCILSDQLEAASARLKD